MSRRVYRILWTAGAREALASITDRRIQTKIVERVRGLEAEPEKQGKPLIGELAGYRSIRTAGQRCRIIFQVEDEKIIVLVIALGLRKEGNRKDIYSLARKLIDLGLAEPAACKRK